MNTITVWLLISFGYMWGKDVPTHVVDRFPSQAECERVAAFIVDRAGHKTVGCIQTTVVKP